MMNPYNFYNQYYPTNKQEIVHVNGENGARAYQLPPDSNILLLDDNAPIVWLVRTDGAGYKTVTPYSITPYVQEPEVDIKSLESRIQRLEDLINANNRKPDIVDAEPVEKSNLWKSSERKTNDVYY